MRVTATPRGSRTIFVIVELRSCFAMSIRIFLNAPRPPPSLPKHKSILSQTRLSIMSTFILNSPSLASTSMASSWNVAQDEQLPDITPFISPYLLRTLEMLHATHGSSPAIKTLSRTLSYEYHRSGLPRPTTHLETYCMKDFTDRYRLPHHLPFISDGCAQIIPFTPTKPNHGVMEDIIEAIRRTTIIDLPVHQPVFYPPTTGDIQMYLSQRWPEKYPPANGVASGWRNTVNQCLTHGQGWNFLTFPPIDGTKNKRHLLFERAFNGSYIVGSGQCKGLNDLKPRAKAAITRTRRPIVATITPPPSGTSDEMTTTDQEGHISPYDMTTPTPEFMGPGVGLGLGWCPEMTFDEIWEGARAATNPYGMLQRAEARLMASMPGGGNVGDGSARSLDEIEADLMGMLSFQK